MSTASGAQSRGQLITIIVLASALAVSVIALVVSLVQLTNEKHAIRSAADNAQVVTKEVAQDSAALHNSVNANTTAVIDVDGQASALSKSADALAAEAAAQAKSNAALKDGADKVSGEINTLTSAVSGIGSALAAQQNASAALVTLVTDIQNDPQLGIGVLASNAESMSTNLQALLTAKCPASGTCTLTAADFNSIIAEAASLSTGLTTQNDALLKNDPSVSAIAAAKSINAGLTAIQAQGTTAITAGKTLLADMKALSAAIADASTTTKQLSDATAKVNASSSALAKSTTELKASSAKLAAESTNFDSDIQSLSDGTYSPDLAELSVPVLVLGGLVLALIILAALVIWMAARRRTA